VRGVLWRGNRYLFQRALLSLQASPMPRCRAATQHVLCVTEVTNTEKKRRGEDAGTAPRNETALAHQLENAQRTVADLQGNPQEEGGANPKVVINYEAFAGKIPRHPTSTQTCAEDPLIPQATMARTSKLSQKQGCNSSVAPSTLQEVSKTKPPMLADSFTSVTSRQSSLLGTHFSSLLNSCPSGHWSAWFRVERAHGDCSDGQVQQASRRSLGQQG